MLSKKDIVLESVDTFNLNMDALPQPRQEFTIELWTTLLEPMTSQWGLCVGLFGEKGNRIYQGWNCGSNINAAESIIGKGPAFVRKFDGMTPFALNTEHHIAIVVQYVGNMIHVTFIKQNVQNGNTVGRIKFSVYNNVWNADEVGKARLSIGGGCKAAYNEVRIWNRALSEEELTQNAIKFHKAGETMKK